MNKYLKWGIIATLTIGVLLYVAYLFLIAQTKKSSPEETVNYTTNGYTIEVFYNRPSKKGREIFGNLVSFDVVWRTGANEATTFETDTELSIGGKTLKAGKYTLWTIPGQDSWTVIFNNKQYGWGIGSNGASREAEFDALQIVVPIESLSAPVEQFTIELSDSNSKPVMSLSWDQTKVSVPIL